MMWIVMAVMSALLLGVYDIFRKDALKVNDVVPVLFFSALTSAGIFVGLIMISKYMPGFEKVELLYVQPVGISVHLQILLKAFIVTSSWVLGYYSLKNLPLTIAVPIRSTAPLWTLIGAVIIFAEKLNPLQLIGVLLTFIFLYLFSIVGLREGIHFRRNKWVVFVFLATLLGTISGLYDKFLIGHYPRVTVQAYFHIYVVLLQIPVFLYLWKPSRRKKLTFNWRWSIPMIGIFLALADFMYFKALSYEDSMISLIAVVRRSSVVVSFAWGALFLKEFNIKPKLLVLLGLLTGVVIIIMGTH